MGYLKQESDIERGFEIVTHPMSYQYAVAHFPWRLFGDLRALGASVAPYLGQHVHASRAGFAGYLHRRRWLRFINRNRARVLALSRRPAKHFIRFTELGLMRAALGFRSPAKDRRRMVNTFNDDTVELWVFASTLQAGQVLAALGFVEASIEYARRSDGDWAQFVAWLAERPQYAALLREIERTSRAGHGGPLVEGMTGAEVLTALPRHELAGLLGQTHPVDGERLPHLARGPPIPAPGQPDLNLRSLLGVLGTEALDGHLRGLGGYNSSGHPVIMLTSDTAQRVDRQLGVDPSFHAWLVAFVIHLWTRHIHGDDHTSHGHDIEAAALIGWLNRADHWDAWSVRVTTLAADIDAAINDNDFAAERVAWFNPEPCAACGEPLGYSDSEDYCSEHCQSAWLSRLVRRSPGTVLSLAAFPASIIVAALAHEPTIAHAAVVAPGFTLRQLLTALTARTTTARIAGELSTPPTPWVVPRRRRYR